MFPRAMNEIIADPGVKDAARSRGRRARASECDATVTSVCKQEVEPKRGMLRVIYRNRLLCNKRGFT